MRAPVVLALVCSVGALSASTSERSIYVGVEHHDRPVAGLTASNFEVTLDEAPVRFRLDTPEPPNVVILAENAIDSRYAFADDIRTALRSFAGAAPAGRYALVTFARTVSTLVDFTGDPSRLAPAYDKAAPPSSDINLSDAVTAAVERLARLPGRHVIIVLASGAEMSADRTGIRLRHLLDRTNVVVFACALGRHIHDPSLPFPADRRVFSMEADTLLTSLTSTSGGWARFPTFDGAIEDVMRAIASEITHQYRLVIDADVPLDGKLHDLDVRAYRTGAGGQRTRVTVHAKRGWRAETEKTEQ